MPLILVPTPLGNLRDITLRALDTLRLAQLIVAEDTRVTLRLCHALEIVPPQIMAFHAHSNDARLAEIIQRAALELVVVVSDAGMPGISDPGSELVRAARLAGVAVEALPGPCAFVGAAVLSGLPIVGLRFLGFVPRKARARSTAFASALQSGATSAWYESPHRIHAALQTLHELEASAHVFVLREYTKRFEQQSMGEPAAVAASLAEPVRGEITLIFRSSAAALEIEHSESELIARMHALLAEGATVAAIAKTLAREGYGERAELYLQVSAARDEG